MEVKEKIIGWSRLEMAQKVALDIPDASYVNLGIGLPELVADHVPEGREVIYHTENGLLGMGPVPEEKDKDPTGYPYDYCDDDSTVISVRYTAFGGPQCADFLPTDGWDEASAQAYIDGTSAVAAVAGSSTVITGDSCVQERAGGDADATSFCASEYETGGKIYYPYMTLSTGDMVCEGILSATFHTGPFCE